MYVAENGDAEYRAGAVDRAQRAVEEPSVTKRCCWQETRMDSYIQPTKL